MTRLLLPLFLAVLCAGCPGTSNPPPAGKCDGVVCDGTDSCDPGSGLCRSADAGAPDSGGLPADGGKPDAGLDGGAGDAGYDAGTDAGYDAGPADAGYDAGFDAGTGGCLSDFDCFLASTHCKVSTGECVPCLDDSHCYSVAPKCDLLVNSCVGCLANADCADPAFPVCDAVQQCLACTAPAQCGPGRTCDSAGKCNPLPDACGSEGVLSIPGALGTVSLTAEPALAIDNTSGTCNATGGPELVYRFNIPSGTRDLSVSVSRLTGSLAQPVVYLRGPSCTAGPQVGCDAPATGAASLAQSGLAAGDWFLFVETAGGAPGRVQVSLTLTNPSTPPANDTCSSAQPLAFGAGTTAVAVGNTFLATNDAQGTPSCSATAGTTGKDVVYSYTLASKSNVSVVARPVTGSTLHPVVSVRSACATVASEVGCIATASATAATVSLPNQAAGTYYVWVDSADGTANAYQLEVTAVPVVDNDSCAAVQALSFAGNTATATGDTTYATNGNLAADPTPSCSPSARTSGRDVVFSYTLASARDVTVSLLPTGASPTFQPVLYVRSGACSNTATANEVGCDNPAGVGLGRLTLLNQVAGTYFVWVDGSQDSAGPFQLEVVQAAPTPPPANDSCAAPQVLTLTSGQATVTGSTLQAANDNSGGDVSPTCSTSAKQNGRDLVYSFTLSTARDVSVTVTPTGAATLHPVLYLRKASCTSQLIVDELVCLQKVGAATAVLTNLPAATYYLWVDGAGGTSGDFSLAVTTSAPTPAPANDNCAGATALTFAGQVATVTGDTFGASNSNSPSDLSPGCGDNWMPKRWGRDLVYTYTLGAPQDVDIQVTPAAGSSLVPVLYARPNSFCSSGSAGYELACIAAKQPGLTRLYFPNQGAGTYALFVDSNTYDTGAFTLTVTKKTPTLPPANDACPNAAVVTLGATGVSGDTTGALNNYSSSTTPKYATACNRYPFDGRDTVYRFNAAATGTVTVTLTPQGLFDAALLYLGTTCDPAQCQRFSDSGPAGAAESMTVPVVAGGSYYFAVDSFDVSQPNTWGAYTLTVQ